MKGRRCWQCFVGLQLDIVPCRTFVAFFHQLLILPLPLRQISDFTAPPPYPCTQLLYLSASQLYSDQSTKMYSLMLRSAVRQTFTNVSEVSAAWAIVLMMKVVRASETSVNVCHTTLRNNREGSHLHICPRKKLKILGMLTTVTVAKGVRLPPRNCSP